MKKQFWAVSAGLALCLAFAGCNNGSSDGGPSVLAVSSADGLAEKLAGAKGGETPDKPVPLVVDMPASEWQELSDALFAADKYVSVDLSGCTDIPEEFPAVFQSYRDPVTFKPVYSKIVSITLPEGITSIGEDAFAACTSLAQITLPASLVSIGYHAFWLCQSLARITLPESVASIGESAFSNCWNLARITLPEGLVSIGDGAFILCGLTQITLPEGLVSIGDMAFYRCAFTQISLPASLAFIGYGAFDSCWNLARIDCLAATPPELGNDADAYLYLDVQDIKIYVPAASVGAYKAAWGSHKDEIHPM